MERDQGAQEEGLGVRVGDLHLGTRVGNPLADSREAGGEAARVGWKLLAHRGDVRGKTELFEPVGEAEDGTDSGRKQ
jgi:hypothetical protein